MSDSNNSMAKTFIVALALSAVCAILVSTAAVTLRSQQEHNKAVDMKKNILESVGLYKPGVDVVQAFSKIETKLVDLETGEYTEAADASTFDIKAARKNPDMAAPIADDNDVAGIKVRSKYMPIYLVMNGEKVEKYIFPIYGKGLWSTLYGFIALDSELRQVDGLTFYEHAETPGLGGEVDNPSWKASWKGKMAFDEDGNEIIQVIKGKIDPNAADANHKVDGLSGATITTRGVDHTLTYWLGSNGYGPFIAKQRQG